MLKCVFLVRAQQMMGNGGTPDISQMMNDPEMMRM
jgi:hypothetical protein